MNPIEISNKYPHNQSDLSYEIKEIDFKSGYELAIKDLGKKPTIEAFKSYLDENRLKVDEKSFFLFLKNYKEPAQKTYKFKLLAALFLLIGTSVFLFGDTNNFYSNKNFIDDLKKEYIAVKVTDDFISCESAKKLKEDKAEYYDMRDEYLRNKAKLTYDYIGIPKLLVIQNLLENTRVVEGKREFCVREKPMRQSEAEELLKDDKWRTRKWKR